MPAVTTVLTDTDSGVQHEEWKIDSASGPRLAGSSDWSISKTTLHGGLSEGVEVVTLNNGELSMSILPTRGMGLWKGSFHDIPIGWDSPVKRPVHPQFVNLQDRSGLGWLNGFNELLVRCGLSSNGAPGTDRVLSNEGAPMETELTLHGKIANLPAHHVEVVVDDQQKGTLSVTGSVDEAMMFGPAMRLTSTVATTVGSNSLAVSDTVTNFGAEPTELQLLYHTNLGHPFLGKGSKLVAAMSEVAPRDAHAAQSADTFDLYGKPVAGFREECFFFELLASQDDQTTVLLKNAASDRGFSLTFSTQQLPCFTVWKNTQAEAAGYVTGLEPATNFPNLRTFEREQGRVISLQPGESREFSLELAIHDSVDAVATAEEQIRSLQTSEAVRHTLPVDRFAPA